MKYVQLVLLLIVEGGARKHCRSHRSAGDGQKVRSGGTESNVTVDEPRKPSRRALDTTERPVPRRTRSASNPSSSSGNRSSQPCLVSGAPPAKVTDTAVRELGPDLALCVPDYGPRGQVPLVPAEIHLPRTGIESFLSQSTFPPSSNPMSPARFQHGCQKRTNEVRKSESKKPVQTSVAAMQACRVALHCMLKVNRLSHDTCGHLWERVPGKWNEGWGDPGEIISTVDEGPAQLVEGFFTSPGHMETMLRDDLNTMGCCTGGGKSAQVFLAEPDPELIPESQLLTY